MKNQSKILKMILAALFLALSYVLPFLTGQIPEIGAMLCPLHIPVLLCGFICGWPWGLVVGFVAPPVSLPYAGNASAFSNGRLHGL